MELTGQLSLGDPSSEHTAVLLAENLMGRQVARAWVRLIRNRAESPADHKKGARVDISQDTDPEQTRSPPFRPLAESPSSVSLSIVSHLTLVVSQSN